MKILGPNLSSCQLATWAENAIKFELKHNNKNGRENETKTEVGVEWD